MSNRKLTSNRSPLTAVGSSKLFRLRMNLKPGLRAFLMRAIRVFSHPSQTEFFFLFKEHNRPARARPSRSVLDKKEENTGERVYLGREHSVLERAGIQNFHIAISSIFRQRLLRSFSGYFQCVERHTLDL